MQSLTWHVFLCRDIPTSPLFLLSQVSNWFANARRRLKNTVRQPDLSWALRIKLYNKYVQGNAERLSISSDDSCSEGTAATALPLFTLRVQQGSSCKCEKLTIHQHHSFVTKIGEYPPAPDPAVCVFDLLAFFFFFH